MKITALSPQQKDKDRVNVMVDGAYRFSLDISQVIDLGIRIGQEYTDEQLHALENESQFGKLYMRALEYSLKRPHSTKEVQDYLYKKTRDTLTNSGHIRKGMPGQLTMRVFDRLVERGYVNDEIFTRYWIENRRLKKGVSRRLLINELRGKGVETSLIERMLDSSSRQDEQELQKVIARKRVRYPDEQKLMQYLQRQGFSYDDIKEALASEE